MQTKRKQKEQQEEKEKKRKREKLTIRRITQNSFFSFLDFGKIISIRVYKYVYKMDNFCLVVKGLRKTEEKQEKGGKREEKRRGGEMKIEVMTFSMLDSDY